MSSSMLKKLFLSLTLIIFLNINIVYAESCNGLLTQDAANLISDIVNIVMIAIPILLVILCSVDFASVVISEDDNSMKKCLSRIVKRFICAAAIFFVPLIVKLLLGIDAIKNKLNLVDDPMCGITSNSESNEESLEGDQP